MVHKTLTDAKRAKQDEFYTQLSDISNELKYYKAQMRNKTIYCNCDDPYTSNFFKHFALNFNIWSLKRLIAVSYDPSPIAGTQLPFEEIAGMKGSDKKAYIFDTTEMPDLNKDGAVALDDTRLLMQTVKEVVRPLQGNGDFRSRECIDLLEQADIVVTNPPFSLFREYVAQLVKYGKQFLIIGNKNAITYKEIFKLIKENKLWVGVTPMGKDMLFAVPGTIAEKMVADGKEGSNYRIVDGKVFGRSPSMWFTNLDNRKRHEEIPLYKRYTPDEYPKYDNYDAIEIGKTGEIPVDYDGAMGVPITFLDKYNPEQFEIIGMSASAGYDKDVVGLNKHSGFKDARPLIDSKNTYARIFIKRRQTQ